MKADLSYANITKSYHDEDKARELIEKQRWPNGPVCPHCGGIEVYRLKGKPESKRPVRKGVLKCKKCRKQFTATVGTIFEGSHIPLNVWLQAISLMCSSKKGISAHQLHQQMGISYKSAWFMCHRIRYGMAQNPFAGKLTGTIEVDETYIGPPAKGKRGRGAGNKIPVVSLVSRTADGKPGEVRSFPVDKVSAKNLKEIISTNVVPEATIITDDFASYRTLSHDFSVHEVIEHKDKVYVRKRAEDNFLVTTNTVEGYFSLLKRGLVGVYHHVGKNHLHRYCSEFDFRYSNRHITDAARTALAVKGFEGKRLQYHEKQTRLS